MNNRLLHILTTLFLVVITLNGCMYFMQSKMVFFPDKKTYWNPGAEKLNYRDVWLTTADGKKLHAWYFKSPGARKTILFFHGNAGNISYRRESILVFLKLGLDVFIIDYRGYGKSQGKPSETGLYEDAVLAWKYLRSKGVKSGNIILFGRSLGGAVASWLAAKVKPDALILESTFTNARAQANAMLPVVAWFVHLRYKFDSASRMKIISCPVLVIHSPDDEIIPYQFGQQLFQLANPPKYFLKLQGDHNSGFMRSQPGYQQRLSEFIYKRSQNEGRK